MRLTVLGCHSPYPGPGGATAGYLIQTEKTNLLLDCGSGVLSQLTRYLPLGRLDAVILTHFHHDHVADLGVLQYGVMVHQNIGDIAKPLDIYAPHEPKEQASKVAYRNVTNYIPILPAAEVPIGDLHVQYLQTDHPVLCYAVKIQHNGKTIVYGADSGIQTEWLPFAESADVFICEGTYLDRHTPPPNVGHLKVSEAAQIAQTIGCKQLVITHLFPGFTEEEVQAETTPFTTGVCHVAKIGLCLEL